ncbi:MAG: hypothetical protein AB7G44_00080 [Bacteroidia bacterium]
MKTFKNKITVLAFTIAVALSSCTTEDLNFDDRDDFTGNWICQENSTQLGTSSYNVSISKSLTDSTAILISNFYNLGSSNSAKAIVDGNTITINPQLVDNLNVAGSGTLTGTQINLSYTVSAGGTDNVTAVYSK